MGWRRPGGGTLRRAGGRSPWASPSLSPTFRQVKRRSQQGDPGHHRLLQGEGETGGVPRRVSIGDPPPALHPDLLGAWGLGACPPPRGAAWFLGRGWQSCSGAQPWAWWPCLGTLAWPLLGAGGASLILMTAPLPPFPVLQHLLQDEALLAARPCRGWGPSPPPDPSGDSAAWRGGDTQGGGGHASSGSGTDVFSPLTPPSLLGDLASR